MAVEVLINKGHSWCIKDDSVGLIWYKVIISGQLWTVYLRPAFTRQKMRRKSNFQCVAHHSVLINAVLFTYLHLHQIIFGPSCSSYLYFCMSLIFLEFWVFNMSYRCIAFENDVFLNYTNFHIKKNLATATAFSEKMSKLVTVLNNLRRRLNTGEAAIVWGPWWDNGQKQKPSFSNFSWNAAVWIDHVTRYLYFWLAAELWAVLWSCIF